MTAGPSVKCDSLQFGKFALLTLSSVLFFFFFVRSGKDWYCFWKLGPQMPVDEVETCIGIRNENAFKY